MSAPGGILRDAAHERVGSVKVALLGGGTVGAQVTRLLLANSADLAARVGAPLELTGVAVRDRDKVRPDVPQHLISYDPAALVLDGHNDVVVELIGGIEPARSLILAAMRSGASVVTANKALLAAHGAELADAAEAANVDLFYEASVAGGVPLLRPLRESLAGDRVRRVLGIINGTTNYILTKMDEEGADYADVLARAQQLGYAESDPTADVEGFDAAAKAAIIATLAFHTQVTIDDVYCEGITGITPTDIAAARRTGFVVKLLAVAELTPDGTGIVVRVHPAMVPRSHPLASVRDAFNAVFVEAEAAGEVMFYGAGAGGQPTASAVLGDIVAAARNSLGHTPAPRLRPYAGLRILPIDAARTRYTVLVDVLDRPGVLASVANTFAAHDVSIQTVRQDQNASGAVLLIRTHMASEGDLANTVAQLRELDCVDRVVSVIRVEGEGGS